MKYHDPLEQPFEEGQHPTIKEPISSKLFFFAFLSFVSHTKNMKHYMALYMDSLICSWVWVLRASMFFAIR